MSSKFYTLNFKLIETPTRFRWIWKTKVTKKLKIFIWLFFRDRLNSRNLLRRKKYKIEEDNYNCVLCDLNNEESMYHLFFQCPFSTECWNLDIHWNHDIYFFDTIKEAKKNCQHDFFMEVFTIAAWEIWKQRNDKIFRGINPSLQSWKANFCSTVKLNMYRLSQENRIRVQDWINSF
jgi:hypothetical protein